MLVSELSVASPKSSHTKKTHQKSKRKVTRRPRGQSSPLSGAYWVIFLACLTGWGLVFYNSFSEYASYVDHVSEVARKAFSYSSESVLGVEDSQEGEESEGSEDALAEAQSEEGASGEEVSAEEEADLNQVVEDLEEEREEALRKKLLLQLPSETDNPNLAITFVEPTETGVEIQVDGGGFSQAKSPYMLPALAIGSHTIHFRFIDEEEVTQNFEEELFVIPRAPIWAEDQETEFRSDEAVTLSGEALPNSTVIVLVSSDMFTDQVNADEDGQWSVTLNDDVGSGKHVALSFIRKDGYASNLSEPLEFTVGQVEAASDGYEDSGGTSDTAFDESDSGLPWWEKYVNEDNYVMVISGAGFLFIVLVLIAAGIMKLIRGNGDDRQEWMAPRDDSKRKAGDGKQLTLREKFAMAGLKTAKKEASKKDTADTGGASEIEAEGAKSTKQEEPSAADIEVAAKNKKEPKIPDDEKGPGEKDGESADLSVDGEIEPDGSEDIGKKADFEGEDSAKDSTSRDRSKQQVYSKEDFLNEFSDEVKGVSKETNKIKITLTPPH